MMEARSNTQTVNWKRKMKVEKKTNPEIVKTNFKFVVGGTI